MSDFWVLSQPDTIDAERRLADWPNNELLEFEKVSCSIDPEGHRGVRNRITIPLSAVLPDLDPLDFVWTHLSECMVQQYVLGVFTDRHLTGFDSIAARVRFASWPEPPPRFWELVVNGSAGSAAAASGYRVLNTCPGCDLVYDTQIEDPTKVVDVTKWDGSDFFRVSPLSGCIFVTDRVIKTLRGTPFKGWKAYSLAEMKKTFDIVVPGHFPPAS